VNSERIILYLLAFTNFCHVVDFMVLMPLGNELMEVFDIGPRQFSWLVSSYSISAGISSVLAAAYMDRFDRKQMLMFTLGMFAASTLFCSLAPNYQALLAARVMTGTFGGLTGSVVLAIMSDIIPFERRGSAMGIISMAFAFASVLGVPLGLLIADVWGWQAPFRFIFVLTIPAFIALFKILPDMKMHIQHGIRRNPLKELTSILVDSNARKALMLAYFMVMGHFLIIPFITPYSIRNIGLTQDVIKYIYLIGGGCTLFTAPMIGRWADKAGHFKVYTIMLLFSLVSILLITHVEHVSMVGIVFITTMFFIFTSGRMIPAQTMITGAVSPDKRGAFLSLRTALIEFGSGTASLVSGWMVVELPNGRLENYNYVGLLSVSVALTTIWMAAGVRRME